MEKALCEAIVHRFPRDNDNWDFLSLNKAYADAMGKVYDRWSDDLDIAALYADALMCITPWKLWDLKTGEPVAGLPGSNCKTGVGTGAGSPRRQSTPWSSAHVHPPDGNVDLSRAGNTKRRYSESPSHH